MSSAAFRLFGTRQTEPEGRLLRAGDLSVVLRNGNLEAVCFRGHEVLRGIAFLVRDRDWGTCTPRIGPVEIEADDQRFSLRYRACFEAPDGAGLTCDVTISAERNRLAFAATFESSADFETARAGFVVLHPIVGLAGQAVRVRHGDGSVEEAVWPDQIEPWQPFMDIAAITHRVASGIVATTDFEGDVFEMEDQRNWTDASYKTYVRPLARPWPYRLPAGEVFRQSVTLTIAAEDGAAAQTRGEGAIAITLHPTAIALPEIGIGLRPDCGAAEAAAIDHLVTIGARHLICHFDPLAGDGLAALRGFAGIAASSGLKVTLELAVPCRQPLSEEFAGVAALVREAGLCLDTLFVSPAVDRQSTPPGSAWPACPPLEAVYAAARTAFPGVRLGGGMMSYFTELNRKRVPADAFDYIGHCTNPIVHAADDLSVMQSFEALAFVVASTRAIYGDKPYRIGPSTIAMRQNPYGSVTKDNPGLARIPMANVDPRHNGAFGAAWTLAYAATVAPAGLEVLTLSTLAGAFGLVAGEGEPQPAGALRPLAHVIARLARFGGKPWLRVESAAPQAVVGLGAEGVLLLANITGQPQMVCLPQTPRSVTGIGFEDHAVPATQTLALEPYACLEVVL